MREKGKKREKKTRLGSRKGYAVRNRLKKISATKERKKEIEENRETLMDGGEELGRRVRDNG